MKHEGKSTHRLSSNPMEKAFHDAWLEENTNLHCGILLGQLLGEENRPAEVSDRDALVAATVIQWLGSPVGSGFLQQVLMSSNAIYPAKTAN